MVRVYQEKGQGSTSKEGGEEMESGTVEEQEMREWCPKQCTQLRNQRRDGV